MTLRIHFSQDDFALTSLAHAPDLTWESLLSMHMLQTTAGPVVFDRWRVGVRRQLNAPARQLLRLAPPVGYSPDFLTPTAGEDNPDLALASLKSTPKARLRHDMLELARSGRRLPPWAPLLADGDRETLHSLADGLSDYFDCAVGPHWSRIRSRFEAERTKHARTLSTGDFGRLLSTLHPDIVWRPPVLTIMGLRVDRDVHLRGRGLRILPSYFCWRVPTVLKDPDLPGVLVYPMSHDADTEAPLGWDMRDGAGQRRSLEALLGSTRAGILTCISDGRTTTEVSRKVGVSPATVSHHTSVLRGAGLVFTLRMGGAVLHRLTPLGSALLHGPG